MESFLETAEIAGLEQNRSGAIGRDNVIEFHDAVLGWPHATRAIEADEQKASEGGSKPVEEGGVVGSSAKKSHDQEPSDNSRWSWLEFGKKGRDGEDDRAKGEAGTELTNLTAAVALEEGTASALQSLAEDELELLDQEPMNVLLRATAQIPRGGLVAVVGSTGSGKSTLVSGILGTANSPSVS